MQVGGERTLTVPPALGYGKRGSLPQIPGNATLSFGQYRCSFSMYIQLIGIIQRLNVSRSSNGCSYPGPWF